MPPTRRCWLIAALGVAALFCPYPKIAGAQLVRAGVDDLVDQQPVAVKEVIRFTLQGNDLAVSSNVKLSAGRQKVRLRDLAGETHVEIGSRMRGRIGVYPFFRLMHVGDANDTGDGTSQTAIYAQGNIVRIDRTVLLRNLNTTLRLQQDGSPRDRRISEPHEEHVTLQFRTTKGTEIIEDVRASADSFVELLRKFPGPAARQVAPLFHQFGQQDVDVFRVEPEIAWQLFPDAVKADEASAARVSTLVKRLDVPDFRQRDAASAVLELMGGPAVVSLRQIDRGRLSPEQNTRIDAILNRYEGLSEKQASELADEPDFLLRCFTYCEVEPIRAAAADRLIRRINGSLNIKRSDLNEHVSLEQRYRAAEAARSKLPIEW